MCILHKLYGESIINWNTLIYKRVNRRQEITKLKNYNEILIVQSVRHAEFNY